MENHNIHCLTFSSSPFSKIVSIAVGLEEQDLFHMVPAWLFKASPVIQKAFTDPTKAFMDSELLGENGQEFGTLYIASGNRHHFQRLANFVNLRGSLLEEDEKIKDISWSDLVDLYLFALQLEATGMQDAIIAALVNRYNACHDLPAPSIINRLYRAGIRAPNARQIFLDLFMHKIDLTTLTNTHQYPSQFLAALISRLYAFKAAAEKEHEPRSKFKLRPERYVANGTDNPIALD